MIDLMVGPTRFERVIKLEDAIRAFRALLTEERLRFFTEMDRYCRKCSRRFAKCAEACDYCAVEEWINGSHIGNLRVLSCLLSPEKETDRWLGHCLDFDLVTSGRTEDEAWKNLRAVVKMHIEHCLTHNPSDLKHHAEAAEWDTFKSLVTTQKNYRRDKIVLNLVPPREPEPEYWIEARELCHAPR